MSRNLWSEAETDYLITHYHTDSIKSIAKVIGRSYRATYRKAYQVGLTKRPRRNKYSEIEISAAYRWDYIAEHINVPDNELADVLELSPRTVYEYKNVSNVQMQRLIGAAILTITYVICAYMLVTVIILKMVNQLRELHRHI